MAFLRGEILAVALTAAAGVSGATAGRADRISEADAHQESLPESAPPQGGEAEQAGRILKDDGFQKALPKDPAPPDEPFSLSLGPLEGLVRVLLWVALGVVVAVVLAWLVTRVRGRIGDVEAEGASAPAPLEVPLDSAERLAAAGRFAEAIHVLLLETLAALSRAAQLAPSLTSREIVARVPLPARAREALSGLVLAVEVSRFGGSPAGERDYRACLDRFHAFLDTYRRGGARTEGAAA